MYVLCAYLVWLIFYFFVEEWFEAWNVQLLYVAKQCDASHSPMSWADIAFEIDGSDVVQIRPERGGDESHDSLGLNHPHIMRNITWVRGKMIRQRDS